MVCPVLNFKFMVSLGVRWTWTNESADTAPFVRRHGTDTDTTRTNCELRVHRILISLMVGSYRIVSRDRSLAFTDLIIIDIYYGISWKWENRAEQITWVVEAFVSCQSDIVPRDMCHMIYEYVINLEFLIKLNSTRVRTWICQSRI